MDGVAHLMRNLPDRHRRALLWFQTRAGQDEPWPAPLEDGTLLVTRAKGIYKPSWSPYALSIRQNLRGPYPDQEPTPRPDGSWSYFYFQEHLDPKGRDDRYTNRALMACWRDGVPVGVMRQVTEKPRARYHILGLAVISAWEGGYFVLQGIPGRASAKDGR